MTSMDYIKSLQEKLNAELEVLGAIVEWQYVVYDFSYTIRCKFPGDIDVLLILTEEDISNRRSWEDIRDEIFDIRDDATESIKEKFGVNSKNDKKDILFGLKNVLRNLEGEIYNANIDGYRKRLEIEINQVKDAIRYIENN